MEALEVIQKLKSTFQIPEFRFVSWTHQYFFDDPIQGTIELTPSTTFLKKYVPPFDPYGFATKACAKKAGITFDEQKRRWFQNGRDTAKIGTEVHSAIEEFRETGNRVECFGESQPIHRTRFQSFWNIWERELSKLELLVPELKIFSVPHKIAGGIDEQFWSNEKLNLLDYKTGAEMKSRSEFLKYPFDNLRNSDLNKYSIQLSIYTVILETHGFEVGNSFLVWLGNSQGELIQCLDLRDKVKELLEGRRV